MKKFVAALLLFVFCCPVLAQKGTNQLYADLLKTKPYGKTLDPQIWARAVRIHSKAVIIDGHNDIPSPLVDEDFDLGSDSFGKYHKDGDPFHTDLKRMKTSGITGEFFSIYVSASYAKDGGAMRRAMDLIDASYREAEKYPQQLTICTTSAEILRAKKQNKLCVLMGIEGGHAIEDSLYGLRNFYRLGVRYMTLTHNNTNNWADACCSEARHGGLSDFGKEVVREMNRLGMLVDLSHVSDETMTDVLDTTTAPVIYSHSSARKFSDHKRNVPDDILKRVAQNKGVVMINFYPAFLDQRYRDESRQRDERLKTQIEAIDAQFKDNREAKNAAMRKLYSENPIYVPTYEKIVDHIDHIKQIAGIDYIGIGSDYDGVPLLPTPMDGAEDLILVTYEMLKRNYTEQEILKVLGGNFMRVFAEAERVSRTGGKNRISADGSQKKIK